MPDRNDSLYKKIESIVGVVVCVALMIPCAINDFGNILINIGLCIFIAVLALGYTGVFGWLKRKLFPEKEKKKGMFDMFTFGRREDE